MGRALVVVELDCAMTPGQLASACRRVSALLDQGVPVLAQVRATDLAVVDALARMRLWARRRGARLEITGSGGELVELLGLAEVLQVLGQPEPPEKRGVEEVVHVGDPPP